MLLASCIPLFALGPIADCQEINATEPPPVTTGELRLGSLYLRPYLTISRLGYDTNVFNSSTDPVSDLVAAGGPGLDIRRPFGSRFELQAGANASYLYYQDSIDQRGWSGGAVGAATWTGNRTTIGGRYSYTKRFARPEFEIDDRINGETWLTTANLEQKLGSRWALRLTFDHTKTRFDEGRTSEGANPAANRNQDSYRGEVEFAYAVTVKSNLLLGADQQWDRFETAVERDSNSNRVWLGFRLASQTRLFGTARGGVRRFSSLSLDGSNTFPYADVRLGYRFAPRTTLSLRYEIDREFTFFNNVGDQPTSRREVVEGQLDKKLWGDLEIRFFGRLRSLRTDDPVGFINEDGDVSLAIRDDESREAGANLGYLFKQLVRIGFEARYLDRLSKQPGFAVSYWQFGATVEIVPQTIQ